MKEYENEPVKGLPEALPEGEELLWQGEPDWKAMSMRVFYVRHIALYFGILVAFHLVYSLSDGTTLPEVIVGALWQVALGASALSLLVLAGYLYARSTVYTVTNRRLVIRTGVALPMIVNIPWDTIESADLRVCNDGTGDILLSPKDKSRLFYMLLWPHVKPWTFRKVHPFLRGVNDPVTVARHIASAASAERDNIVCGSLEPVNNAEDDRGTRVYGQPSAAQ